jgi:hypothetical protein
LNSWAASSEPITLPSRVIRLPFALCFQVICANPVITAG